MTFKNAIQESLDSFLHNKNFQSQGFVAELEKATGFIVHLHKEAFSHISPSVSPTYFISVSVSLLNKHCISI